MIEDNKRTLVYILGAGRSGSTILGILLGNLPGVFYAGELHYWNIFNGSPSNNLQEAKKFWSEVKEEFNDAQIHFESDYLKYLEHHYSMFFLPWIFKRYLLKQYLIYNQKLLSIIFNKSKKQIIVDSSHYPFRAFYLRRLSDIQIKIIYLYRNPVEVVKSFLKRNIEHKYKNPISSNIYLFFVSLLSVIVFFTFRKQNRFRLKYESLISDTERTLDALRNYLSVQTDIIDTKKLKTGYIFQSNRIRHKEFISIEQKQDDSKFNPILRLFTMFIQLPFLIINRKSDI
ncbi:MAG: sulfotransferase [Ignavibacteriaceae bacterium]